MSKIQFQPRNMNLELLPEREADVVVFDGFESMEFRRFKSDSLWSIAEASTGLPIVRGCDSRAHAYERAEYELKRHGLSRTQDAIKSTLARIADKEFACPSVEPVMAPDDDREREMDRDFEPVTDGGW